MSTLLLDQLPVVMAADRGVSQFLDIVDPMASQLYDVVGSKEVLFDPAVAPLPVLRWLANRLGVEIDSNLPDDVQRRVFMFSAATHEIRGTARSLEMNIAAITGAVVTIDEDGAIESKPIPQHPPASTRDTSESANPGTPMLTIHVSTMGHATVAQIIATIERELRGDAVYQIIIPNAATSQITAEVTP